jgi:hypothetical protein
MTIIVKYLTSFSFTIPSVNMTNPIQPTYSDKRKVTIFWHKITYQHSKNLKKKAESSSEASKSIYPSTRRRTLKDSNKFLQNQNSYYTEFPSAPFFLETQLPASANIIGSLSRHFVFRAKNMRWYHKLADFCDDLASPMVSTPTGEIRRTLPVQKWDTHVCQLNTFTHKRNLERRCK